MRKLADRLSFLRGGPALLVTSILAVEIALFYGAPTAEYIPNPPPLATLQHTIGSWTMVRESPIDSETQALLRADDSLSRAYAGPLGSLTLFVAFFKSQRGGVTPHSPKICLPGAGWTPEEASILSVSLPGEPRPLPVNRYIVRHGDERSLVLYWYSTAHHVVANEYVSRLYLMYEGLRYRRSDEAVFRVMVPITAGEAAAQATALDFIRTLYRPLRRQIWASI
jgi:EpsI family protein